MAVPHGGRGRVGRGEDTDPPDRDHSSCLTWMLQSSLCCALPEAAIFAIGLPLVEGLLGKRGLPKNPGGSARSATHRVIDSKSCLSVGAEGFAIGPERRRMEDRPRLYSVLSARTCQPPRPRDCSPGRRLPRW